MIIARLAAIALALSTATCGEPPRRPDSKLVVLLVIDQWPEWAFEQKRTALTAGGFERLLSEGEWRVGEYPSAATLTAPGHALLGTGAPPAHSGIVANDWYRRDLDRRLASVHGPDGSVDARQLRVEGLGDVLAREGNGAKAVSISLKDRSAILSLGHAGLPIWYDPKTIRWAAPRVPSWLATHSAVHPLATRIHQVWRPLDERPARLSGGADDHPGELGEKGFGARFPHDPTTTPDPADALFTTPAGNTVVLETALAAIEGERLGTDDSPDLLVISLSAHDYIGHGWGHESWEMWDASLRLDGELAQFFTALDRRVGTGRWSMIVTSDHGGSPLPERTSDGGRFTYESMHEVANRAAVAVLGEGAWLADIKYPTIYLSRALLAKPADERTRAIDAIREALAALPGVAWVERSDRFIGDCALFGDRDRAVCLALDGERSGDLIWMPEPHWIVHEGIEPVGTGHGSIHAYDREVPVILLGPDRVRRDPATEPGARMSMLEVAPLLARWLGVPPPNVRSPKLASHD